MRGGGSFPLGLSLSHMDESSPSSRCGSLPGEGGEGRASKANDYKVSCSSTSTQSFNPSFLLWMCKALFQSQLHRIYFELTSKTVHFGTSACLRDQTHADLCRPWLLESFLSCCYNSRAGVSALHSDPQWSSVSLIPRTGLSSFPSSVQFRNCSDFTLCSLIPPPVPKLPLTDCPAVVTSSAGCTSTLSLLC